MHAIQVSRYCAVVVERVLGEDAGSCHFPWAAKQIPSAVQNVVDFAGAEPSYGVAEVSAILALGLLPDPHHRRRRRHLSCP